MEDEDTREWGETLEMLRDGSDLIVSDLSFGEFVTLDRDVFQNLVNEVNDFRITNSEVGDDVQLIVIGDGGELCEKTCNVDS